MAISPALLPSMVTIPAGVFGRENIDAFQLGRTPITNEQYAAHVDQFAEKPYVLFVYSGGGLTDPSYRLMRGKSPQALLRRLEKELPKSWDHSELMFNGATIFQLRRDMSKVIMNPGWPLERFDGPNQPVINISWFHAYEYCVSNGLFLPTDNQWSYAAGVHEGRKYATSTGEFLAGDGKTKLAHFSEGVTIDVDDPRYPDGPHGLRHMSGNVREWTKNSEKHWSYHMRGGSWYYLDDVEVGKINDGPSGSGNMVTGFRVCAKI